MRILLLTTMLLASSLCPAFAQQEGNASSSAPPMDQKSGAAPAQIDQNSQQARNPQAGREQQSRTGDREMGRDWRMHRDDDDNMSRNGREPGPDWRMRDRETSRDRDTDSQRYRERGDRDGDRADRNRNNRDYYLDEDRPHRRVKICLEYANGDEYCHYKR